MADVSAGSTDAFGDLYDRYSQRAYRVANAICRDQEHAEDAVQEAFLSIWHSRTTHQPACGATAAWLLTVVHHRAIDVARRGGRQAEERVRDDRLEAVLGRLPVAQREVITLAYFGQLTPEEIAAHFGVPARVIERSARLGLDRLRADLDAAA
jgi:RNA polymerase sigma-70 factor (ECF subfamily)